MKNKTKTTQSACEQAWKQRFADKPVEPYYNDNEFANASIDGAWPVDIFFSGFYAGFDFAKSKKRAKQKKKEKIKNNLLELQQKNF